MPSLKVILCASAIAMLQFFNVHAQDADDLQDHQDGADATVYEGNPEVQYGEDGQPQVTLTPEQIQEYQRYLQAQQDQQSLKTFFPSWMLFLVFIAFVLGLGYFINHLLQIENDRERKKDEKRRKKELKKSASPSTTKVKSN